MFDNAKVLMKQQFLIFSHWFDQNFLQNFILTFFHLLPLIN